MGSGLNPILVEFARRLRKSSPFFAGAIETSYERFGDSWADEAAADIVAVFGPPGDPRWAEATKGYALFCVDALKSQRFFEVHGRYAATSYESLKRDYWDNPGFMLNNYLPGMFLSYYLWSHHYRLIRFYREEVLPAVLKHGPRTFCEVGCGTAMYSRETLRGLPEITGTAYDVSDSSLSFGQRILDASGLSARYRFEKRDVLVDAPEPYDYLVCQEVLEHLEKPAELTRALFRMVKPGRLAYVTAAVTAGHPDHIYLFRSPAEVEAMIHEAGFAIEAGRTEQAEKSNVPELAPRISCYLCRRPP